MSWRSSPLKVDGGSSGRTVDSPERRDVPQTDPCAELGELLEDYFKETGRQFDGIVMY